MFLVTDTDYLSDKVSEKLVLTKGSYWLDHTSNMTKIQPLQNIQKLYLGNRVSKFVEITCR